MISLLNLHRVVTLVLVLLARYPEKVSPLVDLCITVGLHCAMNDNGRFTFLMHIRDFADIIWILGFSEALIMYDHIIRFCPVRIVI